MSDSTTTTTAVRTAADASADLDKLIEAERTQALPVHIPTAVSLLAEAVRDLAANPAAAPDLSALQAQVDTIQLALVNSGILK